MKKIRALNIEESWLFVDFRSPPLSESSFRKAQKLTTNLTLLFAFIQTKSRTFWQSKVILIHLTIDLTNQILDFTLKNFLNSLSDLVAMCRTHFDDRRTLFKTNKLSISNETPLPV